MDGGTVSWVLFSGTDDRLSAAAVLAAGAAAIGREVNVFLQYWALDAFRADRIPKTTASRRRPAPTGPRRTNGTAVSTGARSFARRRTRAR